MNPFKARQVNYHGIVSVADWKVKVYAMSADGDFKSSTILANAINKSEEWIKRAANYDLPNYKIACLIVHEGKEGVFNIINWWVDENMLQNHVFLTAYNDPTHFEEFSDRGLQFCVWELSVIWFERNQWITHILKKADQPDFEAYLNASFSGEV